MTPEERARAAVDAEWTAEDRAYNELWMGPGSPDRAAVAEVIEKAIRAAIAEEREVCLAAVVRADCGGPECGYCGCRQAAEDAIRSREEPATPPPPTPQLATPITWDEAARISGDGP